ncbi:MAG: ribosome small subunit-dependent GTPase A [Thermoleophilia bacterium]|nr:ribosome small subunit-dependent GTPase A [Thermoleophilia bacterium]
MSELESLGWTDRLSTLYEAFAGDDVIAGRVSVQHRGAYDVLTEVGELRCDVPRRLVHEAETTADLPVVGDWVVVAPRPDDNAGTITAVLPRFTKFSRKTAWQAAEEQVLAANIDVAFLVASMNEDLSLRRLERYLILAWESGAQPVIVLTKTDLHAVPEAVVAEVETIAGGVPVIAISSKTGVGLEEVSRQLTAGLTAVLLGSSGVGKSTLVNTLAGEELLATQEIRDDGKGRHTTTRRELIQLPGGALIIDTPGIRELQLWVAEDGIGEAFDDVTALFASCKFSDCAHDREPGCAMHAALDDGSLSAERWESYLKLQAELEHLDRKLDKRAASAARKKWIALSKEGRENMRMKGNR